MHYQLFFREEATTRELAFMYYDATLRKAVEIPSTIINEIDIGSLESRRRAVNWQIPADDLIITDRSTWKQEAAIEEIIIDLEVLGSTGGEGLAPANTLKYKYWIDPRLQSMIADVASLKSKYELTQRFYIIHGAGITASEAYRFLNNKWLEKKILANSRVSRQHELEQKEVKAVSKGTNNKR